MLFDEWQNIENNWQYFKVKASPSTSANRWVGFRKRDYIHRMELNNRKTINAWCSYDLANSVYNLIITTAIFPIYYTSITEKEDGSDLIHFFGIQFDASVLYSYAISLSFLIAVALYPVLSGLADYRGNKRGFMRFFTYLGSAACMGLFFFDGNSIELGIILAIIASLSYASSVVFYNAFLPEIASEEMMDGVSAKGFSMGYLGSVFLLIICLVMITTPTTFSLSDAGVATRVSFILVGAWWFGFSHIALGTLKDRPIKQPFNTMALQKGIKELQKVLAAILPKKNIKLFLSSFFFYSTGVQTVMLLSPLFAASVVGMEGTEMIVVILIIQLVAIAGATLFAKIAQRHGNKSSLIVSVLIWLGICVAGFFIQDKIAFYALAGVLGLVMGGIQSVSRSTFAKLIPTSTTDTASYFSFYDTTEKAAIVIGTFSYGLIEQVSGNMRNSILFMGVFFIIATLILNKTKLNHISN